MKYTTTKIPYQATGMFSQLVRDYVEAKGTARDYVQYAPTMDGIQQAILGRHLFKVNRPLLVEVLKQQYALLPPSTAVNDHVNLLLSENTYAITTAHQPNIFTGPLYFFYKIIHTIQLASALKKQFPDNNFVPVYYMGSEDADIDEVGTMYVGGSKMKWETKQKGAIGRMKVDDQLIDLLKNIEGYWGVMPAGKEALVTLINAYQKGVTINEATLQMVHAYFGQYGLVVVQPDNASLKSCFISVMEKELTTQFSHAVLQPTIEKLRLQYHVQTQGRLLNLFYLKDNIRARIEYKEGVYTVVDTHLSFSQAEIIQELHEHPDRFSPNVILRGLYQETILPGIVFIGGGGELAYWMELKEVFAKAKVHYPVLELRNSFLVVKGKIATEWAQLGFQLPDLFLPDKALEFAYIKANAQHNLSLANSIVSLQNVYDRIQQQAILIDATLGNHTLNLSIQSLKKIKELEKKMVKAEKKKQTIGINRIQKIKKELFPENNLQERVENFSDWVGVYGWDWVDAIMQNSNTLENSFVILVTEN
jgi:hypothetical protein